MAQCTKHANSRLVAVSILFFSALWLGECELVSFVSVCCKCASVAHRKNGTPALVCRLPPHHLPTSSNPSVQFFHILPTLFSVGPDCLQLCVVHTLDKIAIHIIVDIGVLQGVSARPM
jgi:hypothetical protein